MDAIKNITNRVSARELAKPYPSQEEMAIIYKGALRSPDHAWLRPSSFIEVKDDGLDKLSDIFYEYALSQSEISSEVIEN